MIFTQRKQKQRPPFLGTFERSLRQFPLQTGDKIVVGVSGGPDSVCLLYFLKDVSDRLRYSLHVAHLNHDFRPEAEGEARFVEELCASWGLPITSSKLPVPQICKERHLSKQAGAREIRYAFLKEVARETGAHWIALGHTADDQAETFLMRMLRGAGTAGLGAIPNVREGWIIRPLLKISRSEILAALSEKKIPFLEDPSNQRPIYLRNRVRHELLPLLNRYNPKAQEVFCQEAELLRDENELLSQMTERLLSDMDIRLSADSISFDVGQIQALHPALQRRVLRWGIGRFQGGMTEVGYRQIETILSKIVPGPTGKSRSLPGGVRIEKRYAKLVLEKRSKAPQRPDLSSKRLPFPSPGPIDLPEWRFRLRLSLYPGAHLSFSPCIASFDFDKITLPLSVRSWQAGDAFVPNGMNGGHKKLQDFFVDAKIPKLERKAVPLLTCSEGILWVIGHRPDERFRATEQTQQMLIVEIEKY